jgi:outer membrane receptor protein involved in Fe transport
VPTTRLPSRFRNRRPETVLSAAISLALGLVPALAHADDPGSDSLEPIVVTANRREQSTLDVPYNISAVSGTALENAQITNLNDIARLLPGVTIPDMGSRGNSGNSLITIRGLNVNDPITASYLPWGSVPMVSTYIDDVPLFVDLKLDDVQRVEVLRGPQGTLYGSGAVGGTIKILHNAPDTTHFSAQADAETSLTQHAGVPSYSAKFIINEPLSSTLATRFYVAYDKTAGFIDARNAVVFGPNQQPVLADPAHPLTSGYNTQPLSHVDDAHTLSLRAAVLWKPTDGLEANFAYQRQDDHSNGFSHQTAGLTYQTATLVPNEPEHRTVDLGSLTLTADAGFATVTSSTSYSRNKVSNTFDESQFILNYEALSPLYYGEFPRTTSLFFLDSKESAFTQELRLSSKEGTAWDYTAGGFFQHQGQHLYQTETVPGYAAWSKLPGSTASLPAPYNTLYSTMDSFFQGYYGGTAPSQVQPTDTDFTYLQLSSFTDRALFGELTRHITPRWQVTGGARFFWQTFDQNLYSTIPYGGPVYSTLPPAQAATDTMGTTIVDRNQGFHDHTFKLNTGYEISTVTHAYATYSEGFRHGGVNSVPIGACIFCENPAIIPYKSDTVKNYEVGIKGTSGNWLRYSAALFRINWDNMQIQTKGYGGDQVVINGKSARSQGLELETNARFGGGWSANLGYGFTDARLTQDFAFFDVLTTVPLVTGKAGSRLPNVPRQTLTGDLSYARMLTAKSDLDAHLNAVYRSDVVTQIDPSVAGYTHLGGFTTLNGSVGLSYGNAWHGRLYVNNIANVMGITSAGALFQAYPDPRYNVQNPIRPRTVGIGVSYTFE